MKRSILLSLAVFALVTDYAVAEPEHDQSAPDQHEVAPLKYTCRMHPEVVLDHPGNCPKCGMQLVPIKSESKQQPPTSHHPAPARQASASQRSTPKPEPTGHPGEMPAGDHMDMSMHDHGQHPEPMPQMAMTSSVNLADPMSRESSGTSWAPDSTPMYGYMLMLGDDMLMLHGAIFPRYTYVSTRRGDDRIDAPNWFMGMFSHSLGGDTQLGARVMMSLDALTEQGRGYPLLLQSGESWHDMPLHDRQHPHDLFDEVSLTFSHKFPEDFSGYIYFGYPGEPALGPPAFMHRLSAMENPDAPIGHHWEDSTHITFGVATAGLQWRQVKVEGSIFTGREPDENRYDFDRPRFDSYSGRVSWNPTANLALQVSHAYIRSPEALEPQVNRHRTTASAIYNLPLGHDSNWSNSFVWGKNNDAGEKTQAFLLESNYQRGRDAIYARWERVEKSGNELVLPRQGGADLTKIFPVNTAAIGYTHDLSHGDKIDIALGGQFTLDFWPNELDRYYGSGPGYGFQVFVRLRPPLHSHN